MIEAMMRTWTISLFLLSLSSFVSALPVTEWSKKYRGWSYYPDFVVPPNPKGPGLDNAQLTDCAIVWQSRQDSYYHLFYTFFNKVGYQTAAAISSDLIHWDFSPGLVFPYNEIEGSFDYGGVTFGGLLFENNSIEAPRYPLRFNNRYWVLYGSYPHRDGYELRPGAEGVAFSDVLTGSGIWQRYSKTVPILSVYQQGVKSWEKDCIYQPFLIKNGELFYDFYNAANEGTEQSGLASLPASSFPGLDLTRNVSLWSRHPSNPLLPNGGSGSFDNLMASDPKVFWDGDHWTMIYFGGLKDGHADIMIAFSTDLIQWEKDPTPLYKGGGHPTGLDSDHAHKISLIYRPDTNTYYLFYTAVGKKGRGIALLTSKKL
eukprot:TRINITY_DN1620_c0_g1_i1.p1 TRINITY_DN1620_c0_g1~~TRINITY_DN1620_c0_g1_i1.p1  ORF type:complete len:372 (-),score=41.30 TRINITY_DN1620_c0_g1_i1:142-1257(-)